MKFDIKLIHKADFVMENNRIVKMRRATSSRFKIELKSLCDKYGIKADNILIIPDFDESKLPKIKVTLYGMVHEYDTMEEAREYMLSSMANSEGSEQDRYTTVYIQLMEGKTEASDDE